MSLAIAKSVDLSIKIELPTHDPLTLPCALLNMGRSSVSNNSEATPEDDLLPISGPSRSLHKVSKQL